MSDFVKLSSLLKGAQDRIWRDSPKLGLASFWERAAGAEIAASTAVRSFRGGVLTVECKSGGWACELRLAAAELRDRMNALGPPEKVASIRFVHEAHGAWKSRK